MAPDPRSIGPWFTHPLATLFGTNPVIEVPAFCRVVATLVPTPESSIHIEVWLPDRNAWNGKLLGTGNGGSGGVIAYPFLATGVQHGYATTNTDLGTGAPDVSSYAFGVGHPERVIDYAYRATHVMTIAAKQIVEAYYGHRQRTAYFAGCSTGGHQALMEAHRYPGDYDGIVAGDPDTTVQSYFTDAWMYTATHADSAGDLPASKLPLLARAVTADCDGADGLTDGVIDDPRRCHFDPATLQCKADDRPDCLTVTEVAALRRLYAGPHNPRTGALIYPGIEPGSEGGPLGVGPVLAIPPGAGQPVGLAKWAVGWKGPGFDWDTDVDTVVSELGPVLSADPNLSAFARRRGKLLIYSGWSDPAEPPRGIIDFFERVQRASGGPSQTAHFARLFMVPGMSHCSGGTNVSYFDSLAALDRWVERGVAPDRIIGARVDDGVITRTRPVCAYPQVARWTGSGSTDRAGNFHCTAPPLESASPKSP